MFEHFAQTMPSAALLNPFTVDPYVPLIASTLRYLTTQLAPAGPVVAFGCADGGEPAAVAVAVEKLPDLLEVLWIYVAKSKRRQGMGTALLASLESYAGSRGVAELHLAYPTDPLTALPLEGVLQRRGWTLGTQRIMVCAVRATRGLQSDLGRAQSPEDFFPWADASGSEREQLVSWLERDGTLPGALWPFRHEHGMDRALSIGIRRSEEVVGWLIVHPGAPRTLTYSLLGVRPDLQRGGMGLALSREMVRRQIEVQGEGALGIFGASTDNVPMMRLIERQFAPYTAWRRETSVATKRV